MTRLRAILYRLLMLLRDALLVVVAVVPFLLGLLVGAVVALAFWCVAAARSGYEYGRGA